MSASEPSGPLVLGEFQSDFYEILTEFYQISLIVLVYLTDFSPQSMAYMRTYRQTYIFTCFALAKTGLVVSPLRVLFVCPSVHLSATLLGCLVCVICNSSRFHSIIFKLCLMSVHTLKMCTFYFAHI